MNSAIPQTERKGGTKNSDGKTAEKRKLRSEIIKHEAVVRNLLR